MEMEDADWDNWTQHRWQVLPKKKVKTVLLSFHQKKSRKESCCYNAKEIAKNNSSVGLWRKKKL